MQAEPIDAIEIGERILYQDDYLFNLKSALYPVPYCTLKDAVPMLSNWQSCSLGQGVIQYYSIIV